MVIKSDKNRKEKGKKRNDHICVQTHKEGKHKNESNIIYLQWENISKMLPNPIKIFKRSQMLVQRQMLPSSSRTVKETFKSTDS